MADPRLKQYIQDYYVQTWIQVQMDDLAGPPAVKALLCLIKKLWEKTFPELIQ